MSEINAIATNNFILHNIDAKKLYVQEPLFTANSGDAVYVGWRPDETVLWSGNVNASHMPVNLSEPLSSFDKIGFTYKVWDNEWAYCEVPSLTEKYILYSNWIDNSQGGYSFAYKLSANSDKTQLGFQRSMFAAWGSTTTSQSSGGFALQKVVGINRKENA